MALPSFVTGGTGATDAGGAWSYTCGDPNGAGFCVVVWLLQDGNTDGALTSIVGTNIENLAGTDNVWTRVPGPNTDQSWPCGSPAAARQHVFIGRTINVNAPTISGGNSTSEDLYINDSVYQDVSTGTTLATVIENGSAGNATNTANTGTAVTDTAVQTLGVDRLAMNFLAANDDATGITDFTGESGGTWALTRLFESASGTDGTVMLLEANMASAGTIDGGSATSAVSVAWGMVGFALIGTTVVATVETRKTWPALQAVNRAGTY